MSILAKHKKFDAGRPKGNTDVRHVDDFIDDPTSDPYAASWFESFRRPAIDKCRKPDERKLFATYQGSRYRVTGCSRLGDVWLHSNVNEDTSYQRRVDVDECSDWSSELCRHSASPNREDPST